MENAPAQWTSMKKDNKNGKHSGYDLLDLLVSCINPRFCTTQKAEPLPLVTRNGNNLLLLDV